MKSTHSRKKTWKTPFVIALFLLMISGAFNIYAFYVNVDQAYTIDDISKGYSNTDNDLHEIIEFYNNKAFSKPEIQTMLADHGFYEIMDFSKDTIELERISLIFKNNQLEAIQKNW